MPLKIVRGDITKMRVDAIVNAANKTLLGRGRRDGCIHRAAGPELVRECRTLGGCETGEAKLTKGLPPALQIRHPHRRPRLARRRARRGGAFDRLLCKQPALGQGERCQSVAFPLISAGIYGYPLEAALRVAAGTIGASSNKAK